MHTYNKKIYYHDTDTGGVVYYANYLKYLEEARTEFFREKGIDLKVLTAEQGMWFVVKKVDITYKSPARYADTITIASQIVKLKNVSMIFKQEIKRGGSLLGEAETVLVCINSDFEPKVIPEDVAKALSKP